MQKITAKKVTRSAANATSEDGQLKFPPNLHQIVKLSVYSGPMYGLFDSEAVQIVMSGTLPDKLRLQLSPTKRCIAVAD